MHAQVLDPETQSFYRRSLGLLNDANIPFLIGGAYSLACYTGIERHTKDLDVFLRRDDCDRALQTLGSVGCETELSFAHWLAKARCGDDFVDLIFSSGNGVASVDEEWFTHARKSEVLGVPVLLCPPEESIWSKAFVMERERYDGADIAHLLRACGANLDWPRLLRRFGPNWRVLFSHLVLFGFIYPYERASIPEWVTRELIRRLEEETSTLSRDEHLCRGTLISREQYLVDIQQWGYRDARLLSPASMTHADIEKWTDAIGAKD